MSSSTSATATSRERDPSNVGLAEPSNVRERVSAWWFPELEGPDLSIEVVKGQHAALMLLDDHSVDDIFADDDEEPSSDTVPGVSDTVPGVSDTVPGVGVDSGDQAAAGANVETTTPLRLFLAYPIAGSSREHAERTHQTLAEVAEGARRFGAEVIAVGPEVLTSEPTAEHEVGWRMMEQLMMDADAMVIVGSGGSVGLGAAAQHSLQAGKPVLALVDDPHTASIYRSFGAAVVDEIRHSPSSQVVDWLSMHRDVLAEAQRSRVLSIEHFAKRLPRLRGLLMRTSDESLSAARITRRRAQILLSHPTVFAAARTMEIAALERVLADSADAEDGSDVEVDAERDTAALRPRAMSETIWQSFVHNAFQHNWDYVEMLAVVERYFSGGTRSPSENAVEADWADAYIQTIMEAGRSAD